MNRCRLACALVALIAWLPAVGLGAATPSLLTRLASRLEQAPEIIRADFASVALGEMIDAYESEFDQLSAPGQVSRGEIAKQARWGRGLQRYLDSLYTARDELDAGARVELVISLPAQVQLLIGERMVSIGSPRIDKPKLLEQQIVRVYCASFLCDDDLLEPLQELARAPAKEGGWSFASGYGSTYETLDGLSFMFDDVRDRSLKERVCLQIRDELNRLAQALARVRQRGHRIDMQELRIHESVRGNIQFVVFSDSTASVRANLPGLARSPALLEIARSWVAARSKGRPYRQRFPRAERLLAYLLSNR